MKYKREDFRFEPIDTKTHGLIWYSYLNRDDEFRIDTEYNLVSMFSKDGWDFINHKTKEEAEEAINKFLAKQEPEVTNLDWNKAEKFETRTEETMLFSVTLNEGDKLTVERKREKVFSLVDWVKTWIENPEYIAQCIIDGWPAKCNGKTAKEMLDKQIVSEDSRYMVYPEELNKEK